MIRILQQNNRFTKILFALIIGAAVVTMVITWCPESWTTPPGAIRMSMPRCALRASSAGSAAKLGRQDRLMSISWRSANCSSSTTRTSTLPYMMQRAGQMLVQRTILKREADRLGLQVTDEDLRRELQTGRFAQYLFPNGQYIGDDQYINFVQTAFGTSRADFESQVKQDMELQRLQALITGGVTVSDDAVRDAYKEQGTKVKFDYAVISGEDLKKTINPSDADLQTFFKTECSSLRDRRSRDAQDPVRLLRCEQPSRRQAAGHRRRDSDLLRPAQGSVPGEGPGEGAPHPHLRACRC